MPAKQTPAKVMRVFLKSIEYERKNKIGRENIENLVVRLSDKYQITRISIRKELYKFADYWNEKDKKGKQERWEKEKTFELNKRLGRWFSTALEQKRVDIIMDIIKNDIPDYVKEALEPETPERKAEVRKIMEDMKAKLYKNKK